VLIFRLALIISTRRLKRIKHPPKSLMPPANSSSSELPFSCLYAYLELSCYCALSIIGSTAGFGWRAELA
jgi:hypothetical protein